MALQNYTELKHFSTWKECSFDDSRAESMIDDDTQRVINFDKVKTGYLNDLGKTEECAASVDAIGEDDQGCVYMVEFKNGEIDKEQIRNKIMESLLIYCDITHTTLKTTRETMEFILVYNEKNKKFQGKEQKAIYLAQLAKSSCSLYELDKYKGFCLHNAYLMSAKDFARKKAGKIRV